MPVLSGRAETSSSSLMSLVLLLGDLLGCTVKVEDSETPPLPAPQSRELKFDSFGEKMPKKFSILINNFGKSRTQCEIRLSGSRRRGYVESLKKYKVNLASQGCNFKFSAMAPRVANIVA